MNRRSSSLTGKRNSSKKTHDIEHINVGHICVVSSISHPKQRTVRKRAVSTTLMTEGDTNRRVPVSTKIPKAPVNVDKLHMDRSSKTSSPPMTVRRMANVKRDVERTAAVKEQPTIQRERPRRRLEQIESTPERRERQKSATMNTAKQSIKDRKRVTSTTLGSIAARASQSGNHSSTTSTNTSTTNKSSCTPISRQRQAKPTPLRPRPSNAGPKTTRSRAQNTNKQRKSHEAVSAAQKLLEVCQSMRLDFDATENMESGKRSRSDFIDQCLTFSKECDEATGRADRLLEELSFMRCQSRCASKKSAPPSWTKTKTSQKCQQVLKIGARKLAKGVCIGQHTGRESMTDSPMDTSQRKKCYFQGEWHSSLETDDDASTDSAGHDSSSSVYERTSSFSPWMKELAKKSTTNLETPLQEELKICLKRMAALELENRALKELLMLKCGVASDAGIEELLNMTDKSGKELQSPFCRKLAGNISMDSAFNRSTS